jgi:glutamyl-Q tRNA(Asp) synthetase
MATIVTRFAPSPTGLLHLGHAHAALFAHRAARRAGGRFLLRLEDIDAARCRPEFAAAILEDLAWLGLNWDGEVRVQSARLPHYARTLAALRARGLLYPCFCTRAEIAREVAGSSAAPHGPDGPLYPGTCSRLSATDRAARIAQGAPHAWRLDMAAAHRAPLSSTEQGERIACDPTRFGDVVLGRKDVPASYHLCATQDDAEQGVTLVSRGEDLRPATALHRLLQTLMGWPEPAYAHHALLLAPDGARLAKRDGAASLRALRESGVSAPQARARAGFPDA